MGKGGILTTETRHGGKRRTAAARIEGNGRGWAKTAAKTWGLKPRNTPSTRKKEGFHHGGWLANAVPGPKAGSTLPPCPRTPWNWPWPVDRTGGTAPVTAFPLFCLPLFPILALSLEPSPVPCRHAQCGEPGAGRNRLSGAGPRKNGGDLPGLVVLREIWFMRWQRNQKVICQCDYLIRSRIFYKNTEFFYKCLRIFSISLLKPFSTSRKAASLSAQFLTGFALVEGVTSFSE
jgi:hypothetical protein